MKACTVGFVGGGRVVRILLAGWKRAGSLPARVVVADPSEAARAALAPFGTGLAVSADPAAAAAQEVVFLAVHPPAMKEAAAAAGRALRSDATVVSLAPKFPLAALYGLLGGFARVARCIPNAPSVVGRGLNPLAFGAGLDEPTREVVRALFRPLGACPEVAEAKLEAYAIVAAMGPTYLWPQLYELAALGRRFGLGEAESLEAVVRMAAGAAETMALPGQAAADVLDLVPVKPLAEAEPAILAEYRTRLPALFDRIRP